MVRKARKLSSFLEFDNTNPRRLMFTLLERLDHVDGLGNRMTLSFDFPSVHAQDTDGDILTV
ncbi:hypothetical protein OK016_01160 [Vibrio chagasii]|nr:hypothetical protein [Vibrio chagasii]